MDAKYPAEDNSALDTAEDELKGNEYDKANYYLLDFRKAYDTVSRDFRFEVMLHYNDPKRPR